MAQASARKMEFQVHSSISSIPAKEWDACLAEYSSPFLSHPWLRCLEESKSACPSTGWAPQDVAIHIDGRTVGYLPFYIKGHSMGEFILTSSLQKSPTKTISSTTPSFSSVFPLYQVLSRILLHPELVLSSYNSSEVAELNRGVGNFLKQIAVSNKLSSVHLNSFNR